MFELDLHDREIVNNNTMEEAKAMRKESKAKAIAAMRKEEAAQIIQNSGGWPSNQESLTVICNGQSNAGGFYEVFRDEVGKVDCLVLATWIINRHYIDMIISDLESGRLGELVFVLSNRMSQLGKGHLPNFNFLKSQLPGIKTASFRVAKSHAKVFSMKAGDQYVTVSGSGNWSKNPRIENYEITAGKDLFDFHYNWMKAICDAR